MKKIRNYFNLVQIIAVSLLVVVSCKKDDEVLNLSRQFTPATVSPSNGETSVKLKWAASLFTTPGNVDYLLEVSKTTDFTVIDYTKTTKYLGDTISDNKLVIKQNYYARVKAVGKSGQGDSNYVISTVFRITGEQFLNPVTTTDLTDVAVQLTWKIPNPDLTKITVTPASGAPVDYVLSAGEKTAGLKVISGLTSATSYTAEIFADTKSKGTTTFKTRISFSGNIVDISGTTGDPTALITALTSAPSGSTIVLRRGERYNYSAFAVSKSFMVVSAMGFGTNYAVLRSSGSFNGTASTSVDSVVFKDLIIKGANVPGVPTPSYDNHYIFNVNVLNFTLNKLRLDNCTIKLLRGIARGQSGTAGSPITNPPATQGFKLVNYLVNNCVMDSIREFGLATVSNGSSFTNITVTNSTGYRFRRLVDHRVTGNSTITIQNSTFCDVVAGAAAATNAVIDYTGVTPGTVSIQTSIFGRTWNETAAGVLADGIRMSSGSPTVIGSYSTSDFTNATNPISGLLSYSGVSTTLFTDPANLTAPSFKIKDGAFAGRSTTGDPRWRIP